LIIIPLCLCKITAAHSKVVINIIESNLYAKITILK
jgi:hypothetical protein